MGNDGMASLRLQGALRGMTEATPIVLCQSVIDAQQGLAPAGRVLR
jgi:hypothetical protein